MGQFARRNCLHSGLFGRYIWSCSCASVGLFVIVAISAYLNDVRAGAMPNQSRLWQQPCGKWMREIQYSTCEFSVSFSFISSQDSQTYICMCVSLSVHTYVHPSGGPSLCAVSGPTLWPVRFDVSTIRILRVVIDANLTENTQRECKTACVYVWKL